MRRASRGRRDLPVSCSEVAGRRDGLAGLMWAGVEEVLFAAAVVAGWLFAWEGLLLTEDGASAGGVRGCVDGADAPGFGRGEVMM